MNFKPPTFKDVAALIITLAIVSLLSWVKGIDEMVKGALIAAMVSAYHFLFGTTSGSQAKDIATKSTTDNLVEALKESSPSQQQIEDIKK